MPTYKELQDQIEDLQRQAAAARKEELATTIRDIRRKIAEFGLTAADIGLAPPAAGAARGRGRKGRSPHSDNAEYKRQSFCSLWSC